MSGPTVAFCLEEPLFLADRMLELNYARGFPGLGWVALLATKLRSTGISVHTADVILAEIERRHRGAEDVLVVQFDYPGQRTQRLLHLGARAAVLACYESPLYSPRFYGELYRISQPFSHVRVFRGALAHVQGKVKSSGPVYFPSFWLSNANSTAGGHSRNRIVAVVSNKFSGSKPSIMGIRARIRRAIAFIYRVARGDGGTRAGELSRLFARAWTGLQRGRQEARAVSGASLIEQRLKMTAYLACEGELDLFGQGWDRPLDVHNEWARKLSDYVRRVRPASIADKLETMRRYRFSLCIENYSFPGYVTEKLVDSIAAGTVPLYLGAPDVDDFVPQGAFIDLRELSDPEQLLVFVRSLDASRIASIVECGRDFLRSDEGKKFSYEQQADEYFEILREML